MGGAVLGGGGGGTTVLTFVELLALKVKLFMDSSDLFIFTVRFESYNIRKNVQI